MGPAQRESSAGTGADTSTPAHPDLNPSGQPIPKTRQPAQQGVKLDWPHLLSRGPLGASLWIETLTIPLNSLPHCACPGEAPRPHCHVA